MPSTRERFSSVLGRCIEFVLLATLATTVLWMGGVTPNARLVAELGAAIALFLTAVREWTLSKRPGARTAFRAAAPLVLLAGLALAQTWTFQAKPLSRLAPGRAALERELRPEGEAAPVTASISVDPAESRSSAIWLLAVAAFLYAAVRVAADRPAGRRLAFGVAAIASGAALLGIAALLVGDGRILFSIDPPSNAKPFGPFVNRNHFAGLMELGLASALAVLVVEAARFVERTEGASMRARLASLGDRATAPMILSGAMVIVMMAATLSSQSRAGLVGIAIVALVGLVACLVAAGSRRTAITLVASGLVIATALVAWIGPTHVLERFGDVPATNARLSLWSDCIRIAANAPIAGVGMGTFASVYPAYQTMPVFLRFAHAESDWWQLLVEGGGLALVLVALGLPVLVGAIAKAWKGARPSTRTRFLCLGAGVAALVLHGFVDVNLHVPANALAFVLVVGLLLGEAATMRPSPKRAAIG